MRAETSRQKPRINLQASNGRHDAIVCIVLGACIFVVFAPALGFGFVDFDDTGYVVENPTVRDGLTYDGLVAAFTRTHLSNWYPLALVSHMVDTELFGRAAWGHHLTSILLHVANTIALFLLLKRMTSAFWASAVVAAIFAVHPLVVEPVVWISSRKDVLSTLFWQLAVLAYLRYVDRPTGGRYLGIALFFVLGLLTKTSVVALPFVLLLLDYWPLGRRRFGAACVAERGETLQRLVLEKVPLVVLSGVFAGAQYFAQSGGGAVASSGRFPLAFRCGNALLNYCKYVGKTFWPAGLAAHYPVASVVVDTRTVVPAAVFLLAVSAGTWLFRRRLPYLVVGWGWYLVALAPAVGFVQLGALTGADRYAYIPLTGLLIMIAWTGQTAFNRIYARRGAAAGMALRIVSAVLVAVVVAALMVCARIQVGYWRDSETLFRRALAISPRDTKIRANLGHLLLLQGRYEEGAGHFEWVLRYVPGEVEALNNLGVAYLELGKLEKAAGFFEQVLMQKPDSAAAANNLGLALLWQGRPGDAAERFSEVVAAAPDNIDAHYSLGRCRLEQGNLDEAAGHFETCLRLDPEYVPARYDLALVFMTRGKAEAAADHFRAVVASEPGRVDALTNLGVVLAQLGEYADAARHLEEALRIGPNLPDTHFNLGNALLMGGNPREAAGHFRSVVAMRPGDAAAHCRLGQTLGAVGDRAEAVKHLEEALRLDPGLNEARAALERFTAPPARAE